MTIERKKDLALILIRRKVKMSFEEPNSQHSRNVAKTIGIRTGINHLEIHRFHNAIINNNLENSFEHERSKDIAYAVIKAIMEREGFNGVKIRGQLSEAANSLGVSFNELLEFCRETYTEIISEALRPQSQA